MPELPDIAVYLNALRERVEGRRLQRLLLLTPFLLRSVDPPVREVEGRAVIGLRRLGKRLVFELEGELFIVIHLMIAGRLQWKPVGYQPPRRGPLAAFVFENGTLLLTEAGSKRRAALYLVRGEAGLEPHQRGGVEPLECDAETFIEALRRENHTLKRSLTDPRLFSGIGNAYSDEILHRAKLSPITLTTRLSDEEALRLYAATRESLLEWTQLLEQQRKGGFPEKVTAFRPEMAVHGRFGQPCPVCGDPVQRISYADNETNYCATCQTGGRVLADRALSRLLKEDWPRSLEELEERLGR